jgi:hypothetical protein
MLTPTPFDLGLVIMGNSQLAFDAVCCAIIGIDPRTVDHLRLAEEYGFGSLDLGRIKISGDVTLEEAQARARGFKVGLIRVEKYFEGSRITAYAGPPPEPEHSDYCWGGCPGAIEEAIEILRAFDRECDEKMPRMHVVFGAYEGRIDAAPGEKVIFIGDCAQWSGTLAGKPVQIRSTYTDRSQLDPHTARHEDIFTKMAVTTGKIAAARNDPHLRLHGCPVSVAEQVLALVAVAGLKNPYTDTRQVGQFLRGYLGWRSRVALNRIQRKRYQQHGAFADRGQAAPEIAS